MLTWLGMPSGLSSMCQFTRCFEGWTWILLKCCLGTQRKGLGQCFECYLWASHGCRSGHPSLDLSIPLCCFSCCEFQRSWCLSRKCPCAQPRSQPEAMIRKNLWIWKVQYPKIDGLFSYSWVKCRWFEDVFIISKPTSKWLSSTCGAFDTTLVGPAFLGDLWHLEGNTALDWLGSPWWFGDPRACWKRLNVFEQMDEVINSAYDLAKRII